MLSGQNFFAGQIRGSALPAGQTVPAPHAQRTPAGPPHLLPSGHLLQSRLQKEPAGQICFPPDKLVLHSKPAGQSACLELPGGQNPPVHLTGLLSPPAQNAPAGQRPMGPSSQQLK